MTLRLLSSEIVHMDPSTSLWIQLTEFALDPGQSDHEVITDLIAAPGYAHDYASLLETRPVVTEPAVHGRWWRSSITTESFAPCTAASAEGRLQSWADEQEWTEPSFRQPPDVQRRLQEVCALLRTARRTAERPAPSPICRLTLWNASSTSPPICSPGSSIVSSYDPCCASAPRPRV
ncbi:hypothetical protein [Brachybacterium tyrofermentans]|uniref:hypothetical protein n=1 Tax=Brachybacterium tyrofermentans TaxID=47848 RepID=UPI003FCF8F94